MEDSPVRVLARRLMPRAGGDLAARLEQAKVAVRYWKSRFARRTAEVSRLRGTVDELERRIQSINYRRHVRRRAELSPDVLAQLLPLRAVVRPQPAGDAEAASDRARRFEAVSSEYAAVRADAEGRASRLVRVESGGLAWWLPKDETASGRNRKLQRQGFPLRAILQTREVAIGGVMLDIGANIGRTSIPRILLGDVRAIYAAEPEPLNHACLVQNVIEHGLCGFIMPDRVAIGATRGEVRLRRSRYVGGHRVLKKAPKAKRAIETVAVQLWPLDEWLGHIGVDPGEVSFVKVDTQGFEADVLRGARGLLARRHVAWQMEIDPGLLTRAGIAVADLFALMQEHFTHFIDIGGRMPGVRSQPIATMPEALAYVGVEQGKTDIILYYAEE